MCVVVKLQRQQHSRRSRQPLCIIVHTARRVAQRLPLPTELVDQRRVSTVIQPCGTSMLVDEVKKGLLVDVATVIARGHQLLVLRPPRHRCTPPLLLPSSSPAMPGPLVRPRVRGLHVAAPLALLLAVPTHAHRHTHHDASIMLVGRVEH
eukprot:1019869-Prymnesium_polylepis.1